jgi:predicted nucleic-acid-binding protein
VRIAVDTNVLVRLLVRDDEVQVAIAQAALSEASEIVITLPVLLELVWVLTRAYRLACMDIAGALRVMARQSGWVLPLDVLERVRC